MAPSGMQSVEPPMMVNKEPSPSPHTSKAMSERNGHQRTSANKIASQDDVLSKTIVTRTKSCHTLVPSPHFTSHLILPTYLRQPLQCRQAVAVQLRPTIKDPHTATLIATAPKTISQVPAPKGHNPFRPPSGNPESQSSTTTAHAAVDKQ